MRKESKLNTKYYILINIVIIKYYINTHIKFYHFKINLKNYLTLELDMFLLS